MTALLIRGKPLKKPPCKWILATTAHSFSAMAPCLWNSLPHIYHFIWYAEQIYSKGHFYKKIRTSVQWNSTGGYFLMIYINHPPFITLFSTLITSDAILRLLFHLFICWINFPRRVKMATMACPSTAASPSPAETALLLLGATGGGGGAGGRGCQGPLPPPSTTSTAALMLTAAASDPWLQRVLVAGASKPAHLCWMKNRMLGRISSPWPSGCDCGSSGSLPSHGLPSPFGLQGGWYCSHSVSLQRGVD